MRLSGHAVVPRHLHSILAILKNRMEEQHMHEHRRFYIKIKGVPVSVTEETYRAYKRPVWRERKRREVRAEHELSLDLISGGIADPRAMFENAVVDGDSIAAALAALTGEERALLEGLFFNGLTEREYAAATGISQKNVNKKKQRILAKLKNILTS